MSMKTNSRREFLADAMRLAALGVSGTAALSGVSAFATPRAMSSAKPAERGLIPYGAAARSDALVSDLGVNGVREIDGGSAARQLQDAAFRSESVDFDRCEIDF